MVEITATEKNKEKIMKRTEDEDRLRDLCNIKCTSICIIGVSEGEEREKGPQNIVEESITKKLTNMGKETLKSRKCRVPYRINPRRNMIGHISIKLTKLKKKNSIRGTSLPQGYQLVLQQKLYRPEGSGMIYLK